MRYDDQEFEAFYRRNLKFVYWYFWRAGAADDEAHELAQVVFMNAWKARGSYRREAEKSYLQKIALRVLLTRNRRVETEKRRMQHVSAEDPAIAHRLTQPPDVDGVLERRQLSEMINRLPPITRDCVLHQIAGYSYEEIARMVNISVEAVRTRLRDAKALLKEDFDDQQK